MSCVAFNHLKLCYRNSSFIKNTFKRDSMFDYAAKCLIKVEIHNCYDPLLMHLTVYIVTSQ